MGGEPRSSTAAAAVASSARAWRAIVRFFRVHERREEAAAAAFGWRVTVDPVSREPHPFEGFGTSLARGGRQPWAG